MVILISHFVIKNVKPICKKKLKGKRAKWSLKLVSVVQIRRWPIIGIRKFAIYCAFCRQLFVMVTTKTNFCRQMLMTKKS